MQCPGACLEILFCFRNVTFEILCRKNVLFTHSSTHVCSYCMPTTPFMRRRQIPELKKYFFVIDLNTNYSFKKNVQTHPGGTLHECEPTRSFPETPKKLPTHNPLKQINRPANISRSSRETWVHVVYQSREKIRVSRDHVE